MRSPGISRARWAVGVIVPVLAFVAACDPLASNAAGVMRTDSAGIEIVANPAEDRPLPWRFEPVRRLGGAPDGPEAFFELSEWVVDSDAAGRIYVLDATNTRVVVFDSSGVHLRSLGGRGAGPGEMLEPMVLSVDPAGTVHVADFAREALLRWDSAGRHLPDGERMRLLPMAAKPFAVDSLGPLVVVEGPAGVEDSVSWRLVRVGGGSEGAPLAAAVRRRALPVDIGCAMGLFAPLFSPDLVWESKAGRIAVGSGAEYEIRLMDGEREIRVRRALPPRAASREIALQEVGSGEFTVGFRTIECPATAELRVERQGFHPVLPAFSDIEIAWDGSLWVERSAIPGEPRRIDVFDPSGAYLGTLPEDSPSPVAFLPDGSVVAVEQDAMDIDRLVVYRVDRSAEVVR